LNRCAAYNDIEFSEDDVKIGFGKAFLTPMITCLIMKTLYIEPFNGRIPSSENNGCVHKSFFATLT